MESVTSPDLVIQLKLKLLLMKPTHDDIIEAKDVYIQLSIERYKVKLMLRNSGPSVYRYKRVEHSYLNLLVVFLVYFHQLPHNIERSKNETLFGW